MNEDYGYVGVTNESRRRFSELELPTRPQLIQGLRLITRHHASYVDGGLEKLALSGTAVEWVIGQVFPLLNGGFTVAELAAKLPEVGPDQLRDLLQQLYFHGLIENKGEIGAELQPLRFARQASFFSPYLRLTGRRRSGWDAQVALRSSRVVVAGTSDTARGLADELVADGVGDLTTCATIEDVLELEGTNWPAMPGAPLALCVADDLTAFATAFERLNMAYLPIDLNRLMLGPLTLPQLSACPACVTAQYALPPKVNGLSDPRRSALQSALVARARQIAIGWLTWLFPNDAPEYREVWRVDKFGLLPVRQKVQRLPRCSRCGDPSVVGTVTLPTGHRDSAALLYHRSAIIRPWHIQQPAVQQAHFRTDVVNLTRAAHEPAVGETSSPAVVISPSVLESGELKLDALMEILHKSLGTNFSQDSNKAMATRYVASAGNLASPVGYVFVEKISGLSRGVYAYNSPTNALLLVKVDGPSVAVVGDLNASARIIVMGRLGGLASKYGDRGYLYTLLDAGLVLHRLRLVADSKGVRSSLITEFDDDSLTSNLPIDPSKIFPMAVVDLAPGEQ